MIIAEMGQPEDDQGETDLDEVHVSHTCGSPRAKYPWAMPARNACQWPQSINAAQFRARKSGRLRASGALSASDPQRQAGLDRIHRDETAEFPHIAALEQAAAGEVLICRHAFDDDNPHEIGLAGDVEALLDLGRVAETLLHGVDLGRGFADQFDLNEDCDRAPDAGGVQDGHVGGDDARLFHPSDAPLDRGRGQVHRRSDVALRSGVVTLKDAQNGEVKRIEGFHVKQTCTERAKNQRLFHA